MGNLGFLGGTCVLLPAALCCIEAVPSHRPLCICAALDVVSLWEDGTEREEFQLKTDMSEKGYWFDSAGNNPFAPHTVLEQPTGK